MQPDKPPTGKTVRNLDARLIERFLRIAWLPAGLFISGRIRFSIFFFLSFLFTLFSPQPNFSSEGMMYQWWRTAKEKNQLTPQLPPPHNK
jgi:hypothetical protein